MSNRELAYPPEYRNGNIVDEAYLAELNISPDPRDHGREFDPRFLKHSIRVYHAHSLNLIGLKGYVHESDNRKAPVNRNFKYQSQKINGIQYYNHIKWRGFAWAVGGLVLNDLDIVVVDAENMELLDDVLQNFGDTNLIIKTRRGFHAYYKNTFNIKTNVMQSRCIAEIDLMVERHVCAPMSGYGEGDEQNYYWFNRHGFDDEYKRLNEICRIIKTRDLPEIPAKALKYFWPTVFNDKGERIDVKTLQDAIIKGPIKTPDKSPDKPIELKEPRAPKQTSGKPIGSMRDGDGRNQALFLKALEFAGKYKVESKPPTEFINQVFSCNNQFAEPCVSKEVKGVIASAWGYHYQGKNYRNRIGGGASKVKRDAVVSQIIIDRIIEVTSKTRSKRVLKLFNALIEFNEAEAHFPCSQSFMMRALETKSKNLLTGYRVALEKADLIEVVPLKESGRKHHYMFTGVKGEGYATLYRFTDLAKADQQGDSAETR